MLRRGCGAAGQRCMAISVAVFVGKAAFVMSLALESKGSNLSTLCQAKEMIPLIAEGASSLKVADAKRPCTFPEFHCTMFLQLPR
eukprot:4289391-Amphidinium_carterae.1